MDQELIKTFEKVQKISYRVCKYDRNGVDKNLLFGDCRHKTGLLYKLIKKLGYDVKKVKVLFNWQDLPLPKEILLILKKSPTIWPHDSLKVKIGNKLGGAILDVYDDKINPKSYKHEKIILTPHVAGIYGNALKKIVDFIEISISKSLIR